MFAKRVKLLTLFLILISLIILGLMFLKLKNKSWVKPSLTVNEEKTGAGFSSLLTMAPITPSPTETPKPLTFVQMNQLYGPCAYVPTLMYHHIQTQDQAKERGGLSLTVYPDVFHQQMEYLRNQGYATISMSDLISFFDQGQEIPKKSVLLTFDDAYIDFAENAFPILQEFGFKATVFVPTGLVENPNYLTWNQIREISSSGNILFANHTWSHHNVKANKDVIEKEISLADTQLRDHGLDNPKVFCYPYGLPSNLAEQSLTSLGYSLAFTTRYGTALCQKKRLELPRVRIGNSSLKSYGL